MAKFRTAGPVDDNITLKRVDFPATVVQSATDLYGALHLLEPTVRIITNPACVIRTKDGQEMVVVSEDANGQIPWPQRFRGRLLKGTMIIGELHYVAQTDIYLPSVQNWQIPDEVVIEGTMFVEFT